MQTNFKKSLLASTIIVGAATFASPAFAQEEAAEAPAGEEIVVTGSLIRNPNLERSAPVNVTSADEIDLQQANVAEELLREIPGVVPSIGSAVNNGNGGNSFVNLRGLGSNRNVVLLDGVRVVPADLVGRFDLNNIPLSLIERVDVLTGGSSTTYGADAISGVVNFITRRDFAGIEIAASEQITEQGDGNTVRVDVTTGANFDDGRGNVVLAVGYQQADAVYQGDRKIGENTISSTTGGGAGSGTAVPTRFSIPGAGTLQINPAGNALVATYAPFNFAPDNIFQTPFERFNIYGAANYEVSDAIEVYTRGLFSKNTVDTIIAPSGAFGIGVQVPLSNPFLPAGIRNQFCAGNGISTADCTAAAAATDPNDPAYREVTTAMFRRAVEVGPRISDYRNTVFDYRLGARGGITDTIDWDVYGAYGESDQVQTIQGYTLNSRVRQSLLTTTDAGGNFICQDTSNGCIPVNWFTPTAGGITPDMATFLVGESTVQTKTTLAQARATVSGDFGWTIPWAAEPVAFAVGGEYRKYTAEQASDTLASSGDLGGAGGAAPNIFGGFDVYEAIGELIVPLVSDKPFFEELTIEGGIRYSSYSVDAPGSPGYNTTTWKVGGNWTPVTGLGIRGGYARAVRAPNINELFSPLNTGLTSLSDDPCANIRDDGTPVPGRAAPSGELLAICLAQGAPANVIGTINQPIASQANATSGGNLNLGPEKSNSYTVGVVLQPDFLPGFSMTIDYYNIKVSEAISTPAPTDAITACFGEASGANYTPAAGASTSPACLSIGRDPNTGGLNGDPNTTSGLFLGLSNLGRLSTDGIDVTANYRHDFDFADLIIAAQGNWTNKAVFQSTPSSDPIDCVGVFSVDCGGIQPEFQWSVRTTLAFEDIDLSVLWRHLDGSFFDGDGDGEPDGSLFVGTPIGYSGNEDFNKIPSYDYFDLAARFNVSDALTFTVTVQNLFDKKPPLTGSDVGSTSFNSGNTFPSTYDALGRRFGAAVKLRF